MTAARQDGLRGKCVSLRAQGYSQSDIGRLLGVSKNVVCGQLSRHDRESGDSPPARLYTTPPSWRSKKVAQAGILDLEFRPGDPEPRGKRGTLGDGCKWIHGHPADGDSNWLACEHEVRLGSVYCEVHAKRVWAR